MLSRVALIRDGVKNGVKNIYAKFRPKKEIVRRKSRGPENKVNDSLMDYKLYRLAVLQYMVKTGRPFEHVVKQHREGSNVPLLRYENPGKIFLTFLDFFFIFFP